MHKSTKPGAMALLCLAALSLATFFASSLGASNDKGQSQIICQLQAATYFGGAGAEQGWPTTP